MADRADITPELLRQLLRYEPETGKLYWKPRTADFFESVGLFKSWKGRFEGKEAFVTNTGEGYYCGCILYNMFLAHRVAYAIYYGEWPDGQVDHINHNRTDNRIINLRVVTHQENSRNQTMLRTNTSGVTGVSWHKRNKRWLARIVINRKAIMLGSFSDFEEAVAVRRAANIEYGFHPLHGLAITGGEEIRKA